VWVETVSHVIMDHSNVIRRTTVDMVERNGILLVGRSDVDESRISHLMRLRYVTRGVCAFLLRERTAKKEKGTMNDVPKRRKGGESVVSIKRRQKALNEAIESLCAESRLWVCKERLGCVYGNDVETKLTENHKRRRQH